MPGVCGKSVLIIPFDFQETTMSDTTVTKVDSPPAQVHERDEDN